MTENKYILPLVPLRGITIFPGMILHFDVGRPKSIDAIEAAMQNSKLVFLCYQNDILTESPRRVDLAEVGTICEIRQTLRLPDGSVRVLVEGRDRGAIREFVDMDRFVQVEVERLDDIIGSDVTYTQLLMRKIQHLTEEYLELYDRLSPETITALLSVEDPGEMADVIISNIPVKPSVKQSILDCVDVTERMELLISIMAEEIDLLDICLLYTSDAADEL